MWTHLYFDNSLMSDQVKMVCPQRFELFWSNPQRWREFSEIMHHFKVYISSFQFRTLLCVLSACVLVWSFVLLYHFQFCRSWRQTLLLFCLLLSSAQLSLVSFLPQSQSPGPDPKGAATLWDNRARPRLSPSFHPPPSCPGSRRWRASSSSTLLALGRFVYFLSCILLATDSSVEAGLIKFTDFLKPFLKMHVKLVPLRGVFKKAVHYVLSH